MLTPVILTSPSLAQIQIAAEWLARQTHPNLDLEIALHLVLQGRIIPQNTGERIAIVHTPPDLSFTTIRGVVMASSNNANVSLLGSDRPSTDTLLAFLQPHGCFHRIATSSLTKDWLRPQLLQTYQLQREHHPLVMTCTLPPRGSAGRWAIPQDKPTLQAYAEAYRAERGSGSVTQNWDDLIQRQQVAVLENHGTIVSVVKRGRTLHHGIVIGTFTFPAYRQQGFAHQLLAFLVTELLQEYPAVQLWVDEDNERAIALYRAIGFEPIGGCYTGYFTAH